MKKFIFILYFYTPEKKFLNGILSRGFLSGFLPSFFRSTKCYSYIDSSFLVSRIFLSRILKPKMNMIFFKAASRRDCK
jgi:hypothetical protein